MHNFEQSLEFGKPRVGLKAQRTGDNAKENIKSSIEVLTQENKTMNERPNRKSDQIVKQVAEKLADDMIKNWSLPAENRDMAISDLSEALQYHEDGYELARELDGNYDPDAALVDILDQASHLLYSAHADECEKWIVDAGKSGPEVGARVTTNKRQYEEAGEGIVVSNRKDGRSTVSFPKLGHVGHLGKDAARSGKSSQTMGAIIEWEDLNIIKDERKPDEGKAVKTQDLAWNFSCPHCGSSKETWFDRSFTMDHEGKEIEPMGNRCEDCGRLVD